MPVKKKVRRPKAKARDPVVQAIVARMRQELRKRHGDKLTFAQRRDAEAGMMAGVLWEAEEQDLQELVSDDDEVDIGDHRYRRLVQPSSMEIHGRFGTHRLEESLYREVGIRNGPTIKPLEVRAGIVEHMTPDFARIVGDLGSTSSSRAVVTTLRSVGLVPPGRAFLEKRLTGMANTIADDVVALEVALRRREKLPAAIAAVSCGMDRMSVRIAEPLAPEMARPVVRTEPYQRTPPPPKAHNFRMAWVGSTTVYDSQGEPLQTWRYAAPATADPTTIAQRVAADVERVVKQNPTVNVSCIQDGALELHVLPDRLREVLPANTDLDEVTDFEHLMGYLADVVNVYEPAGDPDNCAMRYRLDLLNDDRAIDRICKKLERLGRALLPSEEDDEKRAAVNAALSYVGPRMDKMRYASRKAAGLPIGSGDTENTCWLMQRRVKSVGQSWAPDVGLPGILALRALVLSDRWHAILEIYVANITQEVRRAA